jgi:hypothetical protein
MKKNQTMKKNQLEYLEKLPVWFGFVMLKPINSNRIELVQIKKKRYYKKKDFYSNPITLAIPPPFRDIDMPHLLNPHNFPLQHSQVHTQFFVLQSSLVHFIP